MKKKDKVIIFLGIAAMVLSVVIGLTFAFWVKSEEQTGENIVVPGCFDFSIISEENEISLSNAFPLTYEEGRELTPFTFVVKNTCDLAMEYQINLEVLNTTTMNLSYVDAAFDYNRIKLVSSLKTVDATISGATAKNLGSGKLNPTDERTHELRLWMDKKVTLDDDAENTTFEAKIAITAKPTKEVTETPSSPSSFYACKRADISTLHQETCNQNSSSYYCSATGSIGNGNSITYGNTSITSGVLNTGDAFDCDVNGDGVYDATTERFYYVSDLYTGTDSGADQFDEDIAVLIYHSNVVVDADGVSLNNSSYTKYANSYNYQGPLNAIERIPNTSQWTNIYINENRQIRNEYGGTITNNGASTITFDGYTEKAARFLTTQEISKGCGLTTSTFQNSGILDTDKCRFLLENTMYANKTYLSGYWLETPYTSSSSYVWNIHGQYRYMMLTSSNTSNPGVRPVIEILKSDILY